MDLNKTGRAQWMGLGGWLEASNKNIRNAFKMTSLLFPTVAIFLGSPQNPFIGLKLAF